MSTSTTMTGWDFTQDERDEAREIADCGFCGEPAGIPCLILEPRVNENGTHYEHYVHLPRMMAVFG